MTARRWTAEQDHRLRELRAADRTWDEVAAMMGIGRNSLVERGKRLGARRPPRRVEPPEPADRPARPAGHPACWTLLTAGTALEGAAYPLPVFL